MDFDGDQTSWNVDDPHAVSPHDRLQNTDNNGFDQPLFGHADDPEAVDGEFFSDFIPDEFPQQFDHPSPVPSGECVEWPSIQMPGRGSAAGAGLDPGVTAFRSGGIGSQPTVPAHIHDASFARALLSNCRTTDIVLPWETNFYKELFSDEPFSQSLVSGDAHWFLL